MQPLSQHVATPLMQPRSQRVPATPLMQPQSSRQAHRSCGPSPCRRPHRSCGHSPSQQPHRSCSPSSSLQHHHPCLFPLVLQISAWVSYFAMEMMLPWAMMLEVCLGQHECMNWCGRWRPRNGTCKDNLRRAARVGPLRCHRSGMRSPPRYTVGHVFYNVTKLLHGYQDL